MGGPTVPSSFTGNDQCESQYSGSSPLRLPKLVLTNLLGRVYVVCVWEESSVCMCVYVCVVGVGDTVGTCTVPLPYLSNLKW